MRPCRRLLSSGILFALLALIVSRGFARPPEASAAGSSHWVRRTRTGAAAPGLESYDRLVPRLMAKWGIPGGAVAVAKDGRLVLARGYGEADTELHTPVRPTSRFRLASISKPITSAAVLRLVEQGRLDLDDKVFGRLSRFKIPAVPVGDPRLQEITIRQLLRHTGGWDREKSFDPMFRPGQIAAAMDVRPPAETEAIIRYMLRQRLDHDPGTTYAYSNFGYCLLGRVIEEATGLSYEEAVRRLVLDPCGIHTMRLGRTRRRDRAPGEVVYYHHAPRELASSVFLDPPKRVPWPYGGFYLEAMDSHGAWIGSAVDLMRFVTKLDGSRGIPLLRPETLKLMTERPAISHGNAFYALGWSIRPVGHDANWWHGGSLPGTSTLLVRTARGEPRTSQAPGLAWAALFNLRPKDRAGFRAELDATLWRAAGEVQHWPEGDLFDENR